MSKRIYVGNLPWSVAKVEFEGLFSPFGEIEEALVIANKYTGRSRGFGFVTYKNDADADKAMEEMNEKEVEGRRLVVKVARPSRESQEEGPAEEEQKPKEKKQGPAEEEQKPKEKKQGPAEEEQKPKEKPTEEKTHPSVAELKKKPTKKPKKEKPAEEKKEETEEK